MEIKQIIRIVTLFISLNISSQIRFSEIYFDTVFNETYVKKTYHFGEFIEFYNDSDEDINIEGWLLQDNGSFYRFAPNTIIKARAFLVLANGDISNQAYHFTNFFPSTKGKEAHIIYQKYIELGNDEEILTLKDSKGTIIDQISYITATGKCKYGIPCFKTSIYNAARSDSGEAFDVKYTYSLQRLDFSNKEFIEAIANPFALSASPTPPNPCTSCTSNSFGNENYIYAKTCLSADCVKNAETIQYYDGLGRPKQNIQIKASPTGKDIVTHIEYDALGRQTKDFLPIPQNGTQKGNIYTNPLANASTVYGNEKIYAEKELESSPLSRILGQIQVGNDWEHRPIKFHYEANTIADAVKKFTTTTSWENGATKSILSQSDVYGEAQLYKTTTIDEDGNLTIEFKNGADQILLIRKKINDENVDTYYVYNEYNQLAFVIPPLAARQSASFTSENIDALCYQYRYDGRGRVVEKKIPTKGWEYMVYDQLDRLILTQDANLRTNNNNFNAQGWLFTKYDQFSRVVYTGFFQNSSTRDQLQTALNNIRSNHHESRVQTPFNFSNNNIYYTRNAFPKSGLTILSVNYYDSYPSDSPTIPDNILGQKTLNADTATNTQTTKGLPLVYMVKNIENNQWTKTYTYYDTKARIIGTFTENHLGGYTKIENELDFSGVILRTHTAHKKQNDNAEITIQEKFEYDHQNRLLKHYHKINNQAEELLSDNTYNELSQLANKKIGNALQSIDYTYNIRGWLTKVNNPASLGNNHFAFELKYQHLETVGNQKALYNGNIAQMDWLTSNDAILRRYTYQYDGLNRLTKAFYTKPNTTAPNTYAYNEYISYDANGNITQLQRFGEMDTPTPMKIDHLEYTYQGNILTKIIDTSKNISGYPLGGNFITYDVNGNMTSHLDKGISAIQYNFLNLPNLVVGSQDISYTYRADGIKMKKIYNNIETDYLDGFQYENGVLQFFSHTEGYTKPHNEGYLYVYQYKDHLGNIRLSYADIDGNGSIDPASEILEENNYYPFGLQHQGYNELAGTPAYKYKYQGQELQETGMYMFKYRTYMPDIGRFIQLDPLAEKFPYNSTYAIQENKMGMGIELEGLELLKNHTGFFAIHGNQMTVKQAPITQRDSFGRPTFRAGDIGLSTSGYNPNGARISSGTTGLRLNSYKYTGPTASSAQMQDTTDKISNKERQSFKTTKTGSEMWNLKQVGVDRAIAKTEGIKEIATIINLELNIPDAIKSTVNYVQASNDVKAVDYQANQMGQAIKYVDGSGLDMTRQVRNDTINYIFDGTLPNPAGGIMPNSLIISNGIQIMNANGIPIQSLNEQLKTNNKIPQ